MDASRRSLFWSLGPITPFLVVVIVSNLVFVDASTRLENRQVRVTTRDTDGNETTASKRSDIRMVDLRWRLGPFLVSTSTRTVLALAIETDCGSLDEALSVLLARMRAWIGICLFPIALAFSIATCRVLKWHGRPMLKHGRTFPPLRTAAVCLGVLCVLILGFLLALPLWPASVGELARWFKLAIAGAIPFLYFAVVMPIAEEVVFRAGVCRVLVERLGPFSGIALQAVVFGALHLATPLHAIVGLAGGIVLGAVYVYTRSLTASILLHSGANCALGVACLSIA